MKVSLIFPNISDNVDFLTSSSPVSRFICRIIGWGETSYTPPLSLLMLAAVTPPDIEVKIIDERIERIDYDEPVDLVGITIVTRTAPRAYEIADAYRQRGVKVVVGGIHPSALPKEAIQHADAVVRGEGEGVWPEVLEDFRQGRLKAFYCGRPQMDLDSLPFPRRDLIRHPEMYVTTKALIASRGCPNICTYCAAGVGLSKIYRKRSVSHVIRELEQVPGKIALFMDDNLGCDLDYTKSLMRALVPLRLRWSGPVSVNALEDPEMIDLAARSGCFMLGVGIESISPKVLTSIRKDKTNRPERYATVIRRLQEAGIVAWGNFIIGFDDENPQSFAPLIEFIQKTNIEIVSIYILVPYPGSVLFKQYEREGRLLHKDWRFYEPSGGSCVFLPKLMTPQELMDDYIHILDEIFSWKSILGRQLRSPARVSFGSLAALHMNLQSRLELTAEKASVKNYQKTMLAGKPDLPVLE